MFNVNGKIVHSTFKKYPEAIKYCEQKVIENPNWERPIYYLNGFIKNIELKKCPICGKELTYTRTVISHKIYCSKKCSYSQEALKTTKEKTKETNIQRYGCEWSSNNDDIKKKMEQSKLEKYGDAHYNNRDKTSKTVLEKYGTLCPIHNKEVKEKMLKSMEEKYGYKTNPAIEGGKKSTWAETRKKEAWEKLLEYLKNNNIKPLYDYSDHLGVTYVIIFLKIIFVISTILFVECVIQKIFKHYKKKQQ